MIIKKDKSVEMNSMFPNGDWYEEGLDNEPQRKTALKSHIWKGTYHNFRALMNCINRINDIKN